MNNNDTVQPFTHPGAQQDTGASDNGVTADEQTPSSKHTPSHRETSANAQADLQAQPDAQTNHESDADHAEQPARPAPKKRKRRWGDRSDGRRIRTNPPMARVSPYIMKTRLTSCNMFEDVIDMTSIDKYIKEKRMQGNKNISLMHVLLAAYARVVSQMPAINRFIAHQEVYTRDGDIWISLVIKKEMTLESPDTVVKIHLTPWVTVDDVAKEITRVVEEYRNAPGGDFDDTAAILNKFPGLFLRFAFGFLRFLDYFGKIPKKLINLSPFHGSLFITSMGSLGIPTIFHHLYDFGNIPIFLSFGAKEHKYELTPEGRVERKSIVKYTIVMDERICDGFYYAAALKYLRRLLKNPWLLDSPPETVVEDID